MLTLRQWGYDTMAALPPDSTSNRTLFSQAANLLADLVAERRECVLWFRRDTKIVKLTSEGESSSGILRSQFWGSPHQRSKVSRIQRFLFNASKRMLNSTTAMQALLKANTMQINDPHPNMGLLYLSTAGVVFIGTPHYNCQSPKAVNNVFGKPKDKDLSVLMEGSDIISNQFYAFEHISQQMRIVYFCEETTSHREVRSVCD